MKRIFILVLMFILFSTVSYSQREYSSKIFITEAIDEFGDKTGQNKVCILANGYFSNSATSNSCAQLVISIMENVGFYNFYEYCNSNVSYEDLIITFIGTSTNECIKCHNRIKYNFLDMCSENDTIKVKITSANYYSNTVGVFKIYKCKEFYKMVIEEFGEYIWMNMNVSY